MEQAKEVRSGQIYKHIKGGLYQIITVAEHEKTAELMVVYQALYGNFKVYVSSMQSFLESVEECISDKEDNSIKKESPKEEKINKKIESDDKNDWLCRFLDADTEEEKLEIFTCMKDKVDDRILTNIAFSLDIVVDEGTIEERYESIVNCLRNIIKFQGSRTRFRS